MPKKYPEEQRDRATRMVLDHLDEYASLTLACERVGAKLNISKESLRRWVRQPRSTGTSDPV